MAKATSHIEKIILGVDPGTQVMGYGVLRAVGNKAELITMGVIELKKYESHYLRLGKIYERITGIIDAYKPDEMAIEAPFYGKNVQSMLKLGRAQGVAITAAIMRDIPITEYEPKKIKVAITGNGAASKEQVAGMLQRILKIKAEDMDIQRDATDALGAAYCHFIQMGKPEVEHRFSSWKDFVSKNAYKVHGGN
jgi:crossover junction endodeoxyribonuclease RuvC